MLWLGCALLLVGVTSAKSGDEPYFTYNQTKATLHLGGSRVEFVAEGRATECNEGLCVAWLGEGLTASVQLVKRGSAYRVTLTGPATVSLPLDGALLFGGPVLGSLRAKPLDGVPFQTGRLAQDGSGAVLEPVWFTSAGLALSVDMPGPSVLTQNEDLLSLAFQQAVQPRSLIYAKFELCKGSDLRSALSCFPQTGRMTRPELVARPIFSTWVRYKAAVTQDDVISFASQIGEHDFKASVMEVDDNWETCYGNHQWDKNKFPDPKMMVEELKNMSLLVTLWVHPFINTDCSFFNDSVRHLVQQDGHPGVISWWDGKAGLIDFTKPLTRQWFIQRLRALQSDVGLDGFKFDAGEARYLPGISVASPLTYPNQYTTDYVRTAAIMGPIGEVRVGAGSTKEALFQRLQDTETSWGGAGLQSVIPNVLSLQLVGYPAVLPDMVGGNQYGSVVDKELFIRWLQLNTFLPVIQFSISPWQFDKETEDMSRELVLLHERYADMIVTEIEKDKPDGRRVVSPVWFLSPQDPEALRQDQEFLVGDILSAPVVEQGATQRDVYLPEGAWLDPRTSHMHQGPTTLKNYPAPLSVLPYFIRQHPEVRVVGA